MTTRVLQWCAVEASLHADEPTTRWCANAAPSTRTNPALTRNRASTAPPDLGLQRPEARASISAQVTTHNNYPLSQSSLVTLDFDKYCVFQSASCGVGQQPTSNMTCELCPIGFYQDEPNSERCERCPTGFVTPEGGATSLDECFCADCDRHHMKPTACVTQ